jgi:hypothetical protein
MVPAMALQRSMPQTEDLLQRMERPVGLPRDDSLVSGS